ncbi:MAG: AIR synthase-related protein, partial [Planctomycetota bacterium]
ADAARSGALVEGWRRACDACGVAWGGGETPALAGIVEPGRIDLAAGCTGIVNPKSRLTLGESLGAGDAIVLLEASGIHANGLSLARKLAERLPEGYLTVMPDGRRYGDALLDPTPLYASVTEGVHRAGVAVHYAVNVTGHGWRKLLRHPAALTYRIHTVPPVPPVLDFIRERASMSLEDAYGTFNMGAGFALFVAPDQASAVIDVALRSVVQAFP